MVATYSAAPSESRLCLGRSPAALPPPDLLKIGLDSYDWFLKKGLPAVFEEIGRIEDPTGTMALSLSIPDRAWGDANLPLDRCRDLGATYAASLDVLASLWDGQTGEIVEQTVRLGEFPLMTASGTFLIRGVERVVLSQLVRAPGLYLSQVPCAREILHQATVVDRHGRSLVITTTGRGDLVVSPRRGERMPLVQALQALKYDVKALAADFPDLQETPDGGRIAAACAPRDRRADAGDEERPRRRVDLGRYNLGEAGRARLNERLEAAESNCTLTGRDLIRIARLLIRLNRSPDAGQGDWRDDPGHLGNVRVQAVGDLLVVQFRRGLQRVAARVREALFDRRSLGDHPTPAAVLTAASLKPLLTTVNSFFTGELCRVLDETNPLAEVADKRRLTFLGPGGLAHKWATTEERDVHYSHYGRICPVETPEGETIGLVGAFALYARIGHDRSVETPLHRRDGAIDYAGPQVDERLAVAQATAFAADGAADDKRITVRLGPEFAERATGEVRYADAASNQILSVAAALIPFVEHDDGKRALMGSNMQRQAVPLLQPEAPLVGTGLEAQVARDSQAMVTCSHDGTVVSVTARRIVVRDHRGQDQHYALRRLAGSSQGTCIRQRPGVWAGDRVRPGQALADGPAIVGGELALGRNVLVAFLTWDGYNYEDAIVVSSRLAGSGAFTSIHLEEYTVDLREHETATRQIPAIDQASLAHLDDHGIARIGARLGPGAILVGKVTRKRKSVLSAEERLLHEVFAEKTDEEGTSISMNSSLCLPEGEWGTVVAVRRLCQRDTTAFPQGEFADLPRGVKARITVCVARPRTLAEGDKMAGRHGNKGVIARIAPVEDMPFLEDGTPVDVVLNPVGVPGRMNIGQTLETHLGWAAGALGRAFACPAFDGPPLATIRSYLEQAGLPGDGLATLYDGRTGEPFDQRVTVGFMYMMKLAHLAEDKSHVRATGAYAQLTQQPLGGKAHAGGQRLGENEVWALEAYGAAHTLREMMTVKADDVAGRRSTFQAIVEGRSLPAPGVPEAFAVLTRELRSLCVAVDPRTAELSARQTSRERHRASAGTSRVGLHFRLISPEQLLELSHGEVTGHRTFDARSGKAVKGGLFCESIFGPVASWRCACGAYRGVAYRGMVCPTCEVEVASAEVRRQRMGHINLAIPIAHPWYARGNPSLLAMLLGLKQRDLERVLDHELYMITRINHQRRAALVEREARHVKGRAVRRRNLESISWMMTLDEGEARRLLEDLPDAFEVKTGAEALLCVLRDLDLQALAGSLRRTIDGDGQDAARAKVADRLRLAEALRAGGVQPTWMILTVLPVLPPDLRPPAMRGEREPAGDLNALYGRVITSNDRLRRMLRHEAPEVIVRHEKQLLRRACDALLDGSRGDRAEEGSSLSDRLRGKEGRLRRELLGKRVDFSGRAVIVAGPDLRLGQCGMPRAMALEQFRPFVIRKLLDQKVTDDPRAANWLVNAGRPAVWDALEQVMADRLVLLNRAPTLHRLGLQAFAPVLAEGAAIRLHPLVCQGFNADFDGDTMAVHLPLSPEAQAEAATRLLSARNLLKPSNGEPVVAPNKDMALGCYYLTARIPGAAGEGAIFADFQQAVQAYESGRVALQASVGILVPSRAIATAGSTLQTEVGRIAIEMLEELDAADLARLHPAWKDRPPAGRRAHVLRTTVGRILFNAALPRVLRYRNEVIGKGKLKDVVDECYRLCTTERTARAVDDLMRLGFRHATQSGISFAAAHLVLSPDAAQAVDDIVACAQREATLLDPLWQRGDLSTEERYAQRVALWQEARKQVERVLEERLDRTGPVGMMALSGAAKGGMSQFTQVAGIRGLMAGPGGRIIDKPVLSNFRDGLTPFDYFISTHGTRKGLADTKLGTGPAGYLTRRLIYVAQDTVVTVEDCGTARGIWMSEADEGLAPTGNDQQDQEIDGHLRASLRRRLIGRLTAEAVMHHRSGEQVAAANEEIDEQLAGRLADAVHGHEDVQRRGIRVRSVLTCRTVHGVCRHCYGWDMTTRELAQVGTPVGVLAAQSVGEPGSQLTMRTFHTGGVAGEDITQGLPRVEQLLEARKPPQVAVLADVDGRISLRDEPGRHDPHRVAAVRITAGEGTWREYRVLPGQQALAEAGQPVRAGDLLIGRLRGTRRTSGAADLEHLADAVDLHALLSLRGVEAVQRYIISQIGRIYRDQGENIAEPHLETIVLQMLRRVRVLDPGDTDFLPGQLADRALVEAANACLLEQGRKPAATRQELLSISTAAREADSVLAAGAFDFTTRVFAAAALTGRTDDLGGMTGNVMTGQLIPAGTGFREHDARLHPASYGKAGDGVAGE